MMQNRLSRGSLETILTGGSVDAPVLQLLGTKCMPCEGSADRYRLLLSDGVHSFSYAMLTTQLNHLISSEKMTNFSVIRLDKFLCNMVATDRRVIILLEVTVLCSGNDVGEKLGSPTPYKVEESSGANTNESKSAPNKISHSNNTVYNNSNQQGSNLRQGTPSIYAQKSTTASPVSRINTIDSLTPYQNRWKIRGRVTGKSSVRTWSNSRGEGRLFSFNLTDETGEIRVTAFNDSVDKFFDLVEINKVYFVSKATLKTANKQYTSVQNDYEMTVNPETIIEPCEEVIELPGMTFNFVKIDEMDKHTPNSTIDVIGIVKSALDLSTVVGRQSNKEIQKRDLILVDQSRMSINMTLWANEAVNFNGRNNPVIAVKGVKLSDFGGRSLSVLSSSQVLINPDLRESHLLRSWYDREGQSLEFGSFKADNSGGFSSNWKSLAQVKDEHLGSGEKPDYFTTKATVTFLKKENCMYMACPTESCNKKLVDQGNGMYRCEKCENEFSNFKWRMILTANLADFSGNQWTTFFQDSSEVILGKSADVIGELRSSDENAFNSVFQEAMFKSYIFKLRIKMETFNDESRMKVICMNASPVDHVAHGQWLISEINKLTA